MHSYFRDRILALSDVTIRLQSLMIHVTLPLKAIQHTGFISVISPKQNQSLHSQFYVGVLGIQEIMYQLKKKSFSAYSLLECRIFHIVKSIHILLLNIKDLGTVIPENAANDMLLVETLYTLPIKKLNLQDFLWVENPLLSLTVYS